MIVSAPRQALKDALLEIPQWCAAPLALNNGAQFWAMADTRKSQISDRERYIELIVSTIPPNFWHDLWRIEIETHDEAGTLAIILKILDLYNLNILRSEGSVNTFGERNTMTFVVDASDYSSLTDGNSDQRYRKLYELAELELVFLANLLDKLTLSELGRPKIKIAKMRLYEQLHYDLRVRRERDLFNEKGQRAIKGAIKIPKRIMENLTLELGSEVDYTVAGDTKNRIARILCFPRENCFGHLQVAIPETNSTYLLQRIMEIIAGCGGNIIKYQYRHGLNTKGVRSRSPHKQVSEGYFRADFTLNSFWDHRSATDCRDAARDKIDKNTDLSSRGVFVIHSRG